MQDNETVQVCMLKRDYTFLPASYTQLHPFVISGGGDFSLPQPNAVYTTALVPTHLDFFYDHCINDKLQTVDVISA